MDGGSPLGVTGPGPLHPRDRGPRNPGAPTTLFRARRDRPGYRSPKLRGVLRRCVADPPRPAPSRLSLIPGPVPGPPVRRRAGAVRRRRGSGFPRLPEALFPRWRIKGSGPRVKTVRRSSRTAARWGVRHPGGARRGWPHDTASAPEPLRVNGCGDPTRSPPPGPRTCAVGFVTPRIRPRRKACDGRVNCARRMVGDCADRQQSNIRRHVSRSLRARIRPPPTASPALSHIHRPSGH